MFRAGARDQNTRASFRDAFASGSGSVNQIGAFHSANTIINAQGADLFQQGGSLEARSLKSLSFKGIYSKKRNIEYASGTCSWLLDHWQYRNWLCQPNTILWIAGHPGAGKSTLMKFIVQYESEHSETKNHSCSFFFNAIGEGEEQTFTGLLSSFLHELSVQHRTCRRTVAQAFRRNSELLGFFGEDWQWTKQELKFLAVRALQNLPSGVSVRLYVDALDESENADEVLDFLEDLVTTSSSKNLMLNICISCRHYPNLKRAPAFFIDLGSQTDNDLHVYTHYMLRGLKISEERKYNIQRELVYNSNGIFQWLVLVLPPIRNMLQDGASDSDIWRKLQDLPVDLDALYSSLIQSITKDDLSQSTKLFQWLCYSHKPLNLSEIRVAMAFDQDDVWSSLEEFGGSDNERWISDDSQLIDRLKSLSKGLIGVYEVDEPMSAERLPWRWRQVFFIHLSVQGFMKEKGLALLSRPGAVISSVAEAAQTQLYRSCLKYMVLSSQEISTLTHHQHLFDQLYGRHKSFALMEYVFHSWWAHAKEVTGSPDSQDEIINLLAQLMKLIEGLTHFSKIYALPDGWSVHLRVLYVCAEVGLTGVFRRLSARQDIAIDTPDYNGQTPLSWAAEKGQTELFRGLLETSRVDPHSEDKEFKTPYNIVVQRGDIEMLRMLLNRKDFDPDRENSKGLNPLGYAARLGHTEVFRLLLGTNQLDPNHEDRDGNTPFTLAVRWSHIEIIKILLHWKNFDPNYRNIRGETPLMVVVRYGKVDVIPLFLSDKRVDTNAKDKEGAPLLYLAVKSTSEHAAEVCSLLLKSERIDPNAGLHMLTPLHLAARHNHLEVLQHLIKTPNIRLDARDRRGRTPVHYVSEHGHLEALHMLLNTGRVDPTLKDNEGYTALDLAAQGHPEIAELLLRADQEIL